MQLLTTQIIGQNMYEKKKYLDISKRAQDQLQFTHVGFHPQPTGILGVYPQIHCYVTIPAHDTLPHVMHYKGLQVAPMGSCKIKQYFGYATSRRMWKTVTRNEL